MLSKEKEITAADLMERDIEKPSLDNILDKIDTGYAALGSIEDMKKKLSETEEKKTIIFEWIENNFVEGVDFGIADERSPKKTLLKPGAEKIVRAFNTHAIFQPDWDTWKMLGEPEKVVCYVCYIVDNATGKVIGEGRGAEKVGNKSRDVNKSIKIAEKCGIVDAALYTFMLSEKFTQDSAGKTMIISQLKQTLNEDVSEVRSGVESELTDLQFIIKVLEAELHKKRIDHIGELTHIRKVLFEDKIYDFSTGIKIQ